MAETILGVSLDAGTHWTSAADGRTGADAELIEGLQCGDDWAYEELIQRFQTPVYNLVYRLSPAPAEAPDIVQDVFVKVFKGGGSFRGQSSLKTWIYRIAVNETHNHRRWFDRWRGKEVGLDDEQAEGLTIEQTLPDHTPSPFELAADHETMARIEWALTQLKPVFRTALVLREIEGLSYDEIAEISQVPAGTVKSRILRGREALRHLLTSNSGAASVFALGVVK